MDIHTSTHLSRPRLREVLRRLNVLTCAYLGVSITALAGRTASL